VAGHWRRDTRCGLLSYRPKHGADCCAPDRGSRSYSERRNFSTEPKRTRHNKTLGANQASEQGVDTTSLAAKERRYTIHPNSRVFSLESRNALARNSARVIGPFC
jgi:hypothetical protein